LEHSLLFPLDPKFLGSSMIDLKELSTRMLRAAFSTPIIKPQHMTKALACLGNDLMTTSTLLTVVMMMI
jgi:hypothetical protein